VKRKQKRRFKRRKRERKKECPEDALETSLSRAARRFPDDYSLHGSVFHEGYLLRAHKPTETLKKRPASTRLRSKKVARRATAAITAVGATTWLRPNEAMLLKGSINREKTVGSAANTCLYEPMTMN